MTEPYRLPLLEPLAGIRVHSARAAPDRPEHRVVRWLLDRGAEAVRRHEEHRCIVAALGAITESLRPIPDLVQARLGEVAALATELGMALAREIVGEALDRGICDPTPVVARCLHDAVRGGGELTIHLHPSDLAAVLDRLEQHPELRPQTASVQFAGDPSLRRGAVRAETDSGRLVYDPAEVLERVCEEVRREVAG